jgi:MazG family protein
MDEANGRRPEVAALFEQSVEIMARLRGPGGCPWDREQSFESIRKYTIEECYEVLDAIEREHWSDLAGELGDLLLQVLFYAQMAEEKGHFSIADVLIHLNRKLVRRHPHVFGDEAATAAGNRAVVDAVDMSASSTTGASQVLRNWEAIKRAEKADQVLERQGSERRNSEGQAPLLDTVPVAFPALLEATKLGGKAAKVGFDWPDAHGLLLKVEEECRELEVEMRASKLDPDAAEGEVGDLLFTVVNLARHLHIDPELALKRTNRKFRRRFGAMEQHSGDVPLAARSAAELEVLWQSAKEREAAERPA